MFRIISLCLLCLAGNRIIQLLTITTKIIIFIYKDVHMNT